METLRSEDFSKRAHARLFEAIQALYLPCEPVDPVFAQNGRRVSVPAGDGSSTSVPLSRASYSELIPR